MRNDARINLIYPDPISTLTQLRKVLMHKKARRNAFRASARMHESLYVCTIVTTRVSECV